MTNIYKNPLSLKSFDDDVRAVTDYDGNLYIEQFDSPVYHSSITNAIRETGIDIGDAYDEQRNVTWHRIGNTNDFGLSISFISHYFNIVDGRYADVNPNFKNKLDDIVNKAENINPQFKFLPIYWENYQR